MIFAVIYSPPAKIGAGARKSRQLARGKLSIRRFTPHCRAVSAENFKRCTVPATRLSSEGDRCKTSPLMSKGEYKGVKSSVFRLGPVAPALLDSHLDGNDGGFAKVSSEVAADTTGTIVPPAKPAHSPSFNNEVLLVFVHRHAVPQIRIEV